MDYKMGGMTKGKYSRVSRTKRYFDINTLENIIKSKLGYLLSTTTCILSLLVLTSCTATSKEISGTDRQETIRIPELLFRHYSGAIIHLPTNEVGAEKVFGYLEVINGAGEIEITAKIIEPDWVGTSKTNKFFVEKGIYRLIMTVNGIGRNWSPANPGAIYNPPPNDKKVEFSLSSPSASSNDSIIVFLSIASQSYGLKILNMTIEPWAPSELNPGG